MRHGSRERNLKISVSDLFPATFPPPLRQRRSALALSLRGRATGKGAAAASARISLGSSLIQELRECQLRSDCLRVNAPTRASITVLGSHRPEQFFAIVWKRRSRHRRPSEKSPPGTGGAETRDRDRRPYVMASGRRPRWGVRHRHTVRRSGRVPALPYPPTVRLLSTAGVRPPLINRVCRTRSGRS